MSKDIDSNMSSIIHIENINNTNIPSNLNIIDYDETDDDSDDIDYDDKKSKNDDESESEIKIKSKSNTIKTKNNNSMIWNKSQLEQLIKALKSEIISHILIAKEITPEFPHKIVTGIQVSSKLQQIRRTEHINYKSSNKERITKKTITKKTIKGLKNAIHRLNEKTSSESKSKSESESETKTNHRILNFTNANGHQMKRNFIDNSLASIIQSRKKYKVDSDLYLENREKQDQNLSNQNVSLNSNIIEDDDDDDDDTDDELNLSSFINNNILLQQEYGDNEESRIEISSQKVDSPLIENLNNKLEKKTSELEQAQNRIIQLSDQLIESKNEIIQTLKQQNQHEFIEFL